MCGARSSTCSTAGATASLAAENPDVAAALLEKRSGVRPAVHRRGDAGRQSAVELAALAERLRPGIAVLLTSGYARDLIPSEDRPRISR